eukprot:6407182-Prymnesium_polylepis.1
MHPDNPHGRWCAPAEVDLERIDAWPTRSSSRSAAKYAHFCIRQQQSECEGLRGRCRPRSRRPPLASENYDTNLASGELTAASDSRSATCVKTCPAQRSPAQHTPSACRLRQQARARR